MDLRRDGLANFGVIWLLLYLIANHQYHSIAACEF